MIKGEKTRYSDIELQEFENLINEKLKKAQNELDYIKQSITKGGDSGTDSTFGNVKTLEDGADTAEKEKMNQLAVRQKKFITNLENALIRIKNGTYGICSVTNKLIDKERLKTVPHTTMSIEAKNNQRK